ncbi:teashirt-like 3 [Silurus asotus]|uniref:Teashirt-like 3 n=1 Tax=Silurus asotus TaxID=30991 RepID=A0AAD5FPH5_SILAS|nr:teashirt-like 3 [Silurus asotus]
MHAEDKTPWTCRRIASALTGSDLACRNRDVAWECPKAAGGNLARGLLSDTVLAWSWDRIELSGGIGGAGLSTSTFTSMARRKQRAPKRAPAYDSEDVEEPRIQNEDLKEDSRTTEKPLANNDLRKDSAIEKSKDEHSFATAEFSETDSELHINEANEPTSDVDSRSINIKDNPMKECFNERSEKSLCGSDSLEQIKAIYNGFLSNSFWSSPSLNPSQSCTEKRSETSSSSSSSSSPGGNCYDWHQSAVAKTLQQVSEKQLHPQRETNLFSTVQLYRQSARVYGSIFSGASKFHCKSCSASYDTLVDLTVHMNDTGHYRDDNHEKADKGAKSWSKPRKRSLMELEGKEDAQKVLRCMYCGHSFESLQDLSVHMIKTKHYQKVPLKEPGTSVAAAKVMSSFRKRVPVELDITKLNGTDQKASSKESLINVSVPKVADINKKESLMDHKGISNTAQIKSQILRCMECGQSFETLQQLSAHIMLTGHFVKANQSLQKMDKCIAEQISLPGKMKMKNVKTPKERPCSSTSSPNESTKSLHSSTPLKQPEKQQKIFLKDMHSKELGNDNNLEERFTMSSKFDYLTEEDLQDCPKMNLDILKSLENTVTSAINKAQKGTPSWGGYQSIHAAYQLQNSIKPSVYNSSMQQLVHGVEVSFSDKNEISSSPQQRTPSPKVNLHAMEELVKKVTQNIAEETRKDKDEQTSVARHFIISSATSADRKSASNSPAVEGCETLKNKDNKIADSENNASGRESKKCNESFTTSLAFCEDSAVITVHPEPKQPFVSPLNALQSVMNLHLGKAANPVKPVEDPMSMLLKMSNSMAERAAVASAPISTSKPEPLHLYVYHIDKDQPIDLSKGKRNQCLVTASLPGKVLNSLPAMTKTDLTDTIKCPPVSPVHESALSEISDMLRNFSDSHVLNSQTSHKSESSGIEDSQTSNAGDDASMVHKRNGRQSHWNPQHLLILQAQFTSGLRKTAEGKYVISDLSPQERLVISHATGLSMTTISHWLANVKYQLRRTGRTKFVKNLDSGHPVFFCSECATQIQKRSSYISHLESHLGFRLQDLAKFSCKNLSKTIVKHSTNVLEKTVLSFL